GAGRRDLPAHGAKARRRAPAAAARRAGHRGAERGAGGRRVRAGVPDRPARGRAAPADPRAGGSGRGHRAMHPDRAPVRPRVPLGPVARGPGARGARGRRRRVNVAGAFLKRDYLIATSYKADFLSQIVGILVTVPAIYFLSRMYGSGGAALAARYGGNPFSFLLLGIAFTDYQNLSLRTFNASLRESQ